MLPRLPPSPATAAVELRAERTRELATLTPMAGPQPHSSGGRCAANSRGCLGNQFCIHVASRAVAPAALRDSIAYEYGFSANKRAQLYRVIARNFIEAHMPLAVAVRCGISAPLLAFAGITLALLLDAGYTIEELIVILHLTWRDLLALGFTPWLLPKGCRLIVLYDLVGVRRQHLYQFASLTAAAARHLLSECEAALLEIRWDAWRE